MSRSTRQLLRPARAWMLRIGAVLATVVLTGLGLASSYKYAQAYNQHRGFATVVQLPRAGTGRLLSVHFYSRALHRQADYMVYLPPGYSPARSYPVYYLLHGMPGQPHVFVTIANLDVRLDNRLSLSHVRPMILVFPDGRIAGDTFSDSEWANTPSGQFESYVLEVVHNVDARFSTLQRRQDRVIAGFSAGAYGAMNIALHHLAVFGNVQSWSGYFLQTRYGVFAHASATTLAYNSPLRYVHQARGRLAAYPLRSYLFVGRADGSSVQQAPMARALRALGAPVQTAVYAGGHDWSVWYPRLNQMLVLASQAVSHPLAARPPGTPPPRPVSVHTPVIARHVSRAPSPTPAFSPLRPPAPHPRAGELALIASLLLALISAALINFGFLLQHRGLRASPSGGAAAALRSRTWLTGQGLGWVGFGSQIVAVAIAPLTLVQAFAAGSFALSTPGAARLFGYRIDRRQIAAVTVIALSLCTLPIDSGGRHDALQSGTLIGATLALTIVAAAALAGRRRAWLAAAAAGVFYGAADAAIKADAIALYAHGAGALLSGWSVLAAMCTFAGFLSFQSALRDGQAVNAITLMNALTTAVATALGLAAFGESLGTSTGATVMHVLALALVLAFVRPLLAGQPELPVTADADVPSSPAHRDRDRHKAPSVRMPLQLRNSLGVIGLRGAQAATGMVALALAVLTGIGLLYGLRGLGALGVGPRIPDALPLLQLAGFDGQPVLRVAVAWLPAGIVLGIPAYRGTPLRRFAVVAMAAAPLILFASDASFSLARNLRLTDVLVHRAPPLGPWIEMLLLAAGSTLPATLRFAVPTPWRSLSRLTGRRVVGQVAAGREQHASGRPDVAGRPDPAW